MVICKPNIQHEPGTFGYDRSSLKEHWLVTKLKMRAAALAAGLLTLAGVGYAQRGGGDWLTTGFDVQRSSWVRSDVKINPNSMGAYKLHYKIKTTSTPRQGYNLTSPALMDFFITHVGFRTLAFVGGSGDYTLGIDTDLGKREWDRKFAKAAVPPGPSPACPGGMTSAVTRPAPLGYAPVPTSLGGYGRGNPAKSAVGEPLEGAAGLKELAGRRPPAAPPKPVAPPKRTAAPPSPFEPRTQWVHSLTSDGKLHSVYASNGDEPFPAVDFLPAGAHARGLIVSNRVAYVATVNGCGGVADGIWSLAIDEKKVNSWKAPASPVGTAGFAMGPEGWIYVAAGQELIVLDGATLQQKASWKAPAAFTSSPTLFDHQGKDMVAVTTADGQLHIFDGENLGAPVASIAAAVKGYAVGAVASWQDLTGGRWILVPGSAGVEAFQFTGQALKAGWKTRALVNAGTPLIINSVVFALQKGAPGKNAVIYALDGVSGKELWNSGATITSHVTSGGMAAGGGRVHVSGVDGTQYCFGFHLEI